MSEDDNKSGFVPAEQRKQDHAPLGPSELEFLDRLVAKGEALMHSDLIFGQADALLKGGYAEKVRSYGPLTLIRPTAKGRAVTKIREEMKSVALLPKPERKDS